ncbi:Glutathione-dependent formaldehyde-activating enzyme [Grimontia celer]|uniref:Glutathione-dependent formaldehyde-activating enzyme n=1 Tax=Grimontia celer TaxID=1796497 RepID=A0A128EU67_9GAMM|nr:GFA family protein [Grimontia celer]CZF78132.1 Glutathione-dependent formaldehyde-activating enzyme [Grimontia celer]
MKRTGGCQCGKVRYEVTGEPMQQVFCYCSDCQTRTGGDKWFGIWYHHDNFKFTGEVETKTFTRKGSSGHDVHQHYCPECGVTVCADITIGQFYTIAGPSFDDAESLEPKMAIFTASAPKWAVLPTTIPVFDTFPSNM